MERPRLTSLLTWTVVGTYFLVALGASAATDPPMLAPGIHHAVAVLVGLLLLATVFVAWTGQAPARVRWGLTVVGLAYPVQATLGLAAVAGLRPLDDALHLVGGVAVFAALLVALVAQLEHATTPRDGPVAVDNSDEGGSAAGDGDIIANAANAAADAANAANAAADAANAGDTAGDVATRDGTAAHNGGVFPRLRSRCRAYLELTKPRLLWLLCLLALAGMGLAAAAGDSLDGVTVTATLAGGVLAVGAAGTFNHVYERDRDRRMSRTADRPVATATVSPGRAAAFGCLLGVASLGLFLALVNPLAAALTAAAIGYYSVVYTVLLKPTTQWNTVIGGGAGALPAVIGYVAVGGEVAVPALLLAAVVFCWTPAHFYNLAIVYREDYAAASYPMLPVVRGVRSTRRRIVGWLGATLLTASWLGAVTDLGLLYAVTSTVFGGVFVGAVVRQYRVGSDRATVRSFHASNAYLGCLLTAVVLETIAF
ncbi:MAG: heme o synthase [Halopenitus sp.]